MKKKIVILLLAGTFAFSVVACGNEDSKENNTPKAESSNTDGKEADTKQEASNRDLPEGNYTDMGNGKFSIQTEGGDSVDGTIPVLFISDEILVQIGYKAENMDGSHISFIYIDGMEVSTEQLGELVQGGIDLTDSSLEEGIHTVEVVQYSTDKPNGEIITYKSCQYEVKPK